MPGTEMHRMVTRGNTKEEENKEGWMDGIRWSVTSHGLTEEDNGEKDMRRNLVLGEEKPLYSGQSLHKCKLKNKFESFYLTN
jgi:hypothetical protein